MPSETDVAIVTAAAGPLKHQTDAVRSNMKVQHMFHDLRPVRHAEMSTSK